MENLAKVAGWCRTADDARRSGFELAETRDDLPVGTETLIASYGRLQRGRVVGQGRSVFRVEFTTARAVATANRLLTLARTALATGAAPGAPGYSWCVRVDLEGLEPLTTVVTGRIGDVWVRRSGEPWSPLEGPGVQGVTYVPDSARSAVTRDVKLANGDVVGLHGGPLLYSVVSLGPPNEAFIAPVDGSDTGRWYPLTALRRVDPVELLDPDPEIARCWVAGTPRPKGSMRPIVTRTRGGRVKVAMAEQSSGSRPWRTAVRNSLVKAYRGRVPTGLPVELEVIFVVDRPESSREPELIDPHFGDLDKLIRNVGDAAKDAGVVADDRQVVGITRTRKLWAPPRHPEGAWIIIRESR